MIKKDYLKPTMQVVQLQPHGIICTSDPKTLSGEEGQGGSEDTWYDLE